jgi:hypothetical protein
MTVCSQTAALAWVGTGVYPAWQMRTMNYVYDLTARLTKKTKKG